MDASDVCPLAMLTSLSDWLSDAITDPLVGSRVMPEVVPPWSSYRIGMFLAVDAKDVSTL